MTAPPFAQLALQNYGDITRLRELASAIGRLLQLNDFGRTRLATALLELGRNAIEHGGGGQVRLSLERFGSRAALTAVVSDQGEGIENLDAILAGAAPMGSPGLGLGLRGVKAIAKEFDVRTGREGTQVRVLFASEAPVAQLEALRAKAAEIAGSQIRAPQRQQERIRDLERELADRDLMIDEVHHRVANNLSLVSALIASAERKAQGEETRRLLAELGLKVAAIGRAHHHFQRASGDDVEGVAYLRDIADQAKAAFNHAELDVQIQVSGDSTRLPGRLAIDLGLVVGELVTNAYKHAFRGRLEGAISISLETQPPYLVLIVCDDGPGLPEGVRPERSGSLGWRMIRSVVSRYAGNLGVETASGLHVTLSLPKP